MKEKYTERPPCVLLILDGFGIKKSTWFQKVEAAMPTFFQLQKEYASTLLSADGEDVGLPAGQVGNSEAGHQAIGLGRLVLSDQVKINNSIDDGTFGDNPVLKKLQTHLKETKGSMHIIGLLTDGQGSGHAASKHAKALLAWVQKARIKQAYLHLITDGRDSFPYAAQPQFAELKPHIPANMEVSSVMGRFYAMDRDRRLERSALAYETYVSCAGFEAATPEEALSKAYERGETDEFMLPTMIPDKDGKRHCINSGDAIFFWNLRSDRSRQLLKLFLPEDFETHEENLLFKMKRQSNHFIATMTDFGKGIPGVYSLFPHMELQNSFVEACCSLRQLYIAESEKFAQVTYFFNGGHDHILCGEERFITPSPPVDHYDKMPSMSLDSITEKIVTTLHKQGKDLFVVNMANLDMVAHTGNEKAVLLACRAVDKAISKIWKEVQKANGTLVITSDHGNAEELKTPDGRVDTHHNGNPVPFIVASAQTKNKRLKKGTLCDVAPTVLKILQVDQPESMTGKNLFY